MEAAAEFQALVDTSPSYDFGYYMMGLSFLQMKKPADAEKNLLKAIELNGEKFEYHHSLAKAYFDQKGYAKAVATLKSSEGLVGSDKSKQYHLYSLRGLAYAALEKWGDAVEDLEKAKAIKPSPAVLDRLGAAYYELGYNDKALPVIKQYLASSPNNAAMQLRLTNIYLNLGAEATSDAKKDQYYNAALDAAEKYAALKPNTAEGHNMVGRAALGAAKYEQAEQAFKKVLAADSKHCYAMANLGKTYLATQRWKDAENVLNDASKCAPRMAVVYEGLGFALQKQKRLPEAIEQYDKALQIKPNPAIEKAKATCEENIRIAEANKAMDEEERKNQEAILAEQKRQAEEEAKRKAWEEARKKDD
jgi:superkiller protein 3